MNRDSNASLEIQRGTQPLARRPNARVIEMTPVSTRGMRRVVWPTFPAWDVPLPVRNMVTQAGVFTRPLWGVRANVIFFSIALGLYLATRFVGLTHYPIYFHGDEAIHTVLADVLLKNKGVYEGTFLPTYFKNGSKYNLSLSVYLQVLPTLLFGKSLVVTRGTSILLTLIPAVAVALIVRDFLKLPYWWATTLMLSVVPVWFLHSRTAFETVLSVSMYAGFLYYYLRYRLVHPKYLYAALVFGALTFYAYSPAQMIIVVCGVFLLLFDLPYHLKNWKTGLGGLVLLLLLVLPYIRFRLQVTGAIEEHLRDLGSYWLEAIPLSEKLKRFAAIYWEGISPGYWYIPNGKDLPRHQMGQYGLLIRNTLPFALLGVLVAFKTQFTFRQEMTEERTHIRIAYRTVLLALFIAPLPATLAQIGDTRVMTFVLPITILTTVGLITFLQWGTGRVKSWWSTLPVALGPVLFVGLTLWLILFTSDALRNGPYWSKDYGFGGMQYGAQQIYDKIKAYLKNEPSRQIVLTPNWANNADYLSFYFLDNPSDIQIFSVDSLLVGNRPLTSNMIIILTPQEYQQAIDSKKFKTLEVVDTVNYPNGEPGFYFLRMAYVDNIADLLAQETEARRVLAERTITINGVLTQARYSQLDMGDLQQLFDGDKDTLVRTLEANPAIFELTFAEPLTLQEAMVLIGADKAQITFELTIDPDQPPVVISKLEDGREGSREKVINFGETYFVQAMRIEVRMVEHGEPEHVHLWEVTLH
ncbi:MAG: hypothetical protein H6636_02205 [Anaerolineales bacterium]|nr:hypothetical protein [Anaerolineales bacterium]